MALSILNTSSGRDPIVLSDIGESEVSDSGSPWDGGLQPTKRLRRQPPRPATKKPGSPPPRNTYFDMIYQTKKVREECEGHLNKFRERVLATTPPLDIPFAKLKGLEEKMTRMCKTHGVDGTPSLEQSADDPIEEFNTRHRALLGKLHLMIERATALYDGKLDAHVTQYIGQLQQVELELNREREECKKDSGASEQLAALKEKAAQDAARIEDLEWQLQLSQKLNRRKRNKLTERVTQVSVLETRVKECSEGLGTLRDKLREAESTVADKTGVLEEANKIVSSLEVELKQRLGRIQTLEAQLEKAQADSGHQAAQLSSSSDLSRTRRKIVSDGLTVAEEFKKVYTCKLELGQPATLLMCRTSTSSHTRCMFFLESDQDSLLVTCAPSDCAWSDADRLVLNIARPDTDGERMIIALDIDPDMDWFEGC